MHAAQERIQLGIRMHDLNNAVCRTLVRARQYTTICVCRCYAGDISKLVEHAPGFLLRNLQSYPDFSKHTQTRYQNSMRHFAVSEPEA